MEEPEQSVETRVQARAYAIWEQEGRPHGKSVEHWLMARAEIEAEDAQGASPEVPTAKPKRAPRARSKPPASAAIADAHPGMMGDSTEEQNLNQAGIPEARITEDEVNEAFKAVKERSRRR
jgi:hypothetical protein